MAKPQAYLICGIVSSVCSLIALGVALFAVIGIKNMMYSQAASTAEMKASTYTTWGQVPGNYNVNVTRKYTFFNFTNPNEVFWFNATPIFNEIPSYTYQEYQNFTQETYGDGGNTVSYNYQLFTLPLDDVKYDDPIQIVNLGAFGFWYSAKTMPAPQTTFYGLVTLTNALTGGLMSISGGTLTNVQAATLMKQCLQSQANTNTQYLVPAGITDQPTQDRMWNDPVFGLGNVSLVTNWVQAFQDGLGQGAADIIAAYFGINYAQASALFAPAGPLITCYNTANGNIATQYGCDATVGCNSSYLGMLQWANQQVTKNPGTLFDPVDSLNVWNGTLGPNPEISAYFNNYFMVNVPVNKADYQNVTFTYDQAQSLLNMTPGDNGMYNTNQNTLVHAGNLIVLFTYGTAFDEANNLNDLTPLTPIMQQFTLPSLQHAHVVWSYVKYFLTENVWRTSQGGTSAEPAMGQMSTTFLNLVVGFYAEIGVRMDIISRVLAYQITASGLTCEAIFEASGVSTTTSQAACATIGNLGTTKNTATLYGACYVGGGNSFQNVANKYGLQVADLTNLCTNPAVNSFGSFVQATDKLLSTAYGCPNPRCTDRDVFVAQFSSSAVTRNNFTELNGTYAYSLTLKDWYPGSTLAAFNPIEYMYHLTPLAALFPDGLQPMSFATANQLLTPNSIFNPTVVQQASIAFQKQDWKYFTNEMAGADPFGFITYIRSLTINVAFFTGFSVVQPSGALLAGYPDSLLSLLKGLPPYMSGDPSINNFVNLTGYNCTYLDTNPDSYQFQATMYTGVNDTSLTRHYVSINNISYITYPQAYFDGNDTTTILVSPWPEEIPIQATDGTINSPAVETSDTIPIYLSDVNYIGQLTYSETQDYSDLEAYRFILPESALQSKLKNPDNAKWYQDQWDGFLNVSLVQRAPLFISKGHLLDADPSLQNAIVVQATDGSVVTPNSGDDIYADIEPYSGVLVGTMVRLQINYLMQPDCLIPNPNVTMLPIMLTERGMNFTSDQVQTVFGDLVTARKVRLVLTVVFFTIFAFTLLTAIFMFWTRQGMVKRGVVRDASYNRIQNVDDRPYNKGNTTQENLLQA